MTNKDKTKTTLTPSLRFPEFSGEWEQKRLGEIVRISKGSGISKSDITSEGQYPCIRYGELYTRYSEVITEVFSKTNLRDKSSVISGENDLLIPSSGETALDIARTSHVVPKNVLLGGDMTILSLEKNDSGFFFAYYLSNGKKKEIAKLAQGNSVVHIYGSHLKTLEITRPSTEEQQRIASFLTSLDEWIENLKKQKAAQEKYKKGMMQKIFFQEIRFQNDESKEYPEWEQKRLGELGSIYNGLTGKSGEDFGVGEPFITYKQIFDNSELDTTKFSLVSVSQHEKQNTAQFGDIFFTTSSETPNEVGFSSVLLKRDINPFLNSFSFGFRPRSNLSPYFAKYLFRCPLYRKKIGRLAQGSTRYNISKVSFAKEFLEIPSFDEQHKIAGFLTLIDDLINLSNQRITLAEEWKKGLMQRMFV